MKREHRQAIEMYLSGKPVKEIMERFSISRWGFYLWLRKEGIEVNRKNRYDKEKVRGLRRQGMLLKEIAAEVGCCLERASILCKGIKLRQPDFVVCRTCGELKPFTREFFTPDKEGRFGLRNRCKDCYNAHMRSYLKKRREDRQRMPLPSPPDFP